MAKKEEIKEYSKKIEDYLNAEINITKHDVETRKLKFIQAMILCRFLNEHGEKITQNNTFNKVHKMACRTRVILHIPGTGYDLIPKEYKEEFKNLPDFLFEPKTKEERIKELNDVMDVFIKAKDNPCNLDMIFNK